MVYHGESKWNIATSFRHFFEMSEELSRFVPDYDYLLFDLSDMSEEEIKGDIRLRVGFLLFKYIKDERLRHELPRILRLIAELAQQESALQYLGQREKVAHLENGPHPLNPPLPTLGEGEDLPEKSKIRFFISKDPPSPKVGRGG